MPESANSTVHVGNVGEYSPRKVAAPAYSPEAEKLCTIRSNNSNAGAASPMTS